MQDAHSMPDASCFDGLPNELLLIIWMYLEHAEAVRIFGSMESVRYRNLLEKYYYKTINLRQTSLATFQLYCVDLFDKIRREVQTLRLGHRTSHSQLRILTQVRLGSRSLIDLFPRLTRLVLCNVHQSDVSELTPYLKAIPSLEQLSLEIGSLADASTLICSHLLGHEQSSRLKMFSVTGTDRKNGIVLHHPIPSLYKEQIHLLHLTIYMQDLFSLNSLLQFLPSLSTLSAVICSDVKRADHELIRSWPCPCPSLRKLIFRTHGFVEYFPIVADFILMFRHSLAHLDLLLLHRDPAYPDSLIVTDGTSIYDELVQHLTKLEQLNLHVETVCAFAEHLDSIIRSFQTDYWSSMLIGCHYDEISCVYVIFSLPYVFHDRFTITTDVLHTRFNQTGYRLEHLISMLFSKIRRLTIQMKENETLSPIFTTLLKQGNARRHTISLQPCNVYQVEGNEAKLLTFDRLQVIPYVKNYLREELIDSTMIWLEWMPHLRSLDIDTRMLLKIMPLINQNGTSGRFPSLEELIVRQLDHFADDDAVKIIAQLGELPSLKDVHIEQPRVPKDEHLPIICQICSNLKRLETLKIEWKPSLSSFNCSILKKLFGPETKNCQLEYIHVSENFLQLWIEK